MSTRYRNARSSFAHNRQIRLQPERWLAGEGAVTWRRHALGASDRGGNDCYTARWPASRQQCEAPETGHQKYSRTPLREVQSQVQLQDNSTESSTNSAGTTGHLHAKEWMGTLPHPRYKNELEMGQRPERAKTINTPKRKHRHKPLWPWVRQGILKYQTKSTRKIFLN